MQNELTCRILSIRPFKTFCWPVMVRHGAISPQAPRNTLTLPAGFISDSSVDSVRVRGRRRRRRDTPGQGRAADLDWRIFGEQDEPIAE